MVREYKVAERTSSAVPDRRVALAELKRGRAFRAADPAVQNWISHLLGRKFRRRPDKQKNLT
jgi:hypothetical protein